MLGKSSSSKSLDKILGKSVIHNSSGEYENLGINLVEICNQSAILGKSENLEFLKSSIFSSESESENLWYGTLEIFKFRQLFSNFLHFLPGKYLNVLQKHYGEKF